MSPFSIKELIMSWFNDVFGFEESDYAETQARFFSGKALFFIPEASHLFLIVLVF